MVMIERRYNGPPDSGNGGWSAGTFAALVDRPAGTVVTLRQPPPLDTPFSVVRVGVSVRVYTPDGALVAEAEPTEFDSDLVEPVDFATASIAAKRYPGLGGSSVPDMLRLRAGALGRRRAPAIPRACRTRPDRDAMDRAGRRVSDDGVGGTGLSRRLVGRHGDQAVRTRAHGTPPRRRATTGRRVRHHGPAPDVRRAQGHRRHDAVRPVR